MKKKKWMITILLAFTFWGSNAQQTLKDGEMPQLPLLPGIPAKEPIGSVKLGDSFGHPSEEGYKEVPRDWNPKNLAPEYLTRLYQKSGARFLMIQGMHHDNFDLWNSMYQPWNSVNMGPKRDILREWADACHKYNMRYGVTFHHEYTWWWWQSAFGADKNGDKAGVPYDGHLTLEDGKGKWWEGYDPRMLYTIDLREYSKLQGGFYTHYLDYCKWYATQWSMRMTDDALEVTYPANVDLKISAVFRIETR
ncbi:MAG: alpha-L-fucosidase [Bacteroidaceae bacterium]|nr:alpha-L-fucosidase [Bacteroidaceae bacterium]